MFGYLFNILFTIYICTKLVLSYYWNRLKWRIRVCTHILVTIPSMIFALVTFPSTLFVLSAAWACRQIVHILLMLTMRGKYLGLITGCNVVTSLAEGKEPAAVTVIFTLESDKGGNEIYSAIKGRLTEALESPEYAKLFAVRKMCMGFMYLEKRHFHPDEIVHAIEGADLQEFMNKHCHKDMPGLNTGNFDVCVGLERFEGSYPVAIRVHHCLTDGLAFYNLATGLLCKPDGLKDVYANRLSEGARNSFKGRGIWESVRRLCCAQITTLYPVTCPNDIFSDNTPGEEPDTILTYLFETGEEYVPTVKRIKKRFPDMNFTAVVLTAFSASLAEFYIKRGNSDDIPEHVSATMPMQVNHKRFRKAYSSKNVKEMENDFSVLYPNVCIVPAGKRGMDVEDYIVDRLMIINDEVKRIADSPEFTVNYTILKTIAEVCPMSLLKPVYSLGKMTLTISTMPGGPALELFTGDRIKDVVYFTPKQASVGLAFSSVTYANKLQLGLKANATKISNSKELDEILQGVFKYLDVLDTKTVDY